MCRFEAGTDTTSAALSTFILAAITYPQVFTTAQKEVERVCGDQPPSMSHFEPLEYVRAMCKETLRWRTVTAGGRSLLHTRISLEDCFSDLVVHGTLSILGFPHMSSATHDDSFHGYRIPAGTVILPNHWGMCLRYIHLYFASP